jgi:hypothetical protein
MPENKTFVINDRRKFTSEGELRPDAPPSEREPEQPSSAAAVAPAEAKVPAQPIPFPSTEAVKHDAAPAEAAIADTLPDDDHLPPPPTAEQTEQATRAYDATVDRLDTAIRATNPGMERIPEMTYERVVQSLYMQALLQLGGAAEPGQTPQVDILGARQTIDMLAIIAAKSSGNLSDEEAKLTQSALFELRMGFLEITQALARQAGRPPGAPTGPSIVR